MILMLDGSQVCFWICIVVCVFSLVHNKVVISYTSKSFTVQLSLSL